MAELKPVTPTPETNAASYYPDGCGECVDANIARKLERERDDALSKIDMLRSGATKLPGCMIGPSDPCEAFQQAILERDEARQELAELRRDAERYRWLRSNPGSADALPSIFDELIDAAMRGTKP